MLKIALSNNLKKWVLFLGLITIITSVVDVGISLYIWDSAGDLSKLIWFHVAMFLTMPLVSLLSGWITDYLNPKISLIISFSAYVGLLFSAGAQTEYFLTHLFAFGALTGLATAMQSVPLGAITSRNVLDEERDAFMGNQSMIAMIIGLLLPVAVAIVKRLTGDLTLLFLGVVPLSVLMLLGLSRIGIQIPDHEKFSWRVMLGSLIRNPDGKSLFLADVLMAIKDGVFWVLRNVLAYVLLGSIAYWGIYSVVFQCIKIGVSKWLAGKHTIVNSRAWFLLSGFLYTAASVLLVVDFSVINFLLFSLVDSIFGVLTSVIFSDAVMRMMANDPLYFDRKLETEYGVLREFHLGLGRVLPLLLMAYVFVGLGLGESITAMKLVFILVGFVPQMLSIVLIRSRGFGTLIPDDLRSELLSED